MSAGSGTDRAAILFAVLEKWWIWLVTVLRARLWLVARSGAKVRDNIFVVEEAIVYRWKVVD